MASASRNDGPPHVCITGIGGFVGGYLAAALMAAGVEVSGTAYAPAEVERLRAAGVERVTVADILDTDALADAFSPATHIAHLAAVSSGAAGQEAWKANVDGTRNVLAAAAGRRVLLASTGYVYGPVQPSRPAREEDPLNPLGDYAGSKAAMERMAAEEFPDADIVVARSFNHTGPGQGDAFAVPAFAKQIAMIERGEGDPVLSVGNLDALREMMDVRDVVRAYVALLLLPGEAGRVFNVASGEAYPMRAVLAALLGLSTAAINVETDPERLRPSDVPCSTGDPSRLQAATSWLPEIPLARTLHDTLVWWRKS